MHIIKDCILTVCGAGTDDKEHTLVLSLDYVFNDLVTVSLKLFHGLGHREHFLEFLWYYKLSVESDIILMHVVQNPRNNT